MRKQKKQLKIIWNFAKTYGEFAIKKTNKFIYIGILDDRILWCDSEKTENATLMRNEDIKSVYDIMSKYNEDFKKNYFVDKIKDEDYNYKSFEPIWNKFA